MTTPTTIPPVPVTPETRSLFYCDLSDVQSYMRAWLARDAAQTAEIERLKKLIPWGLPKPETLWGVNASNKYQHDRHRALFGPTVQAWRYFQQPGEPLAWPKEYALQPGERFFYSGKPDLSRLTEEMLLPLFRAADPEVDFYYCPWHEPSEEIDKGWITKTDYDRAFVTARRAADKVGPHIKILPILEGWNWYSARKPEFYLPSDSGTYDAVGVDVYFDGVIGPPVAKIPTQFDPMIATAEKFGKPWGPCELGIGQKVTGQARLDALTLLARTVKAKGAAFAMYFNNDTWALDAQAAAAWRRGGALA